MSFSISLSPGVVVPDRKEETLVGKGLGVDSWQPWGH